MRISDTVSCEMFYAMVGSRRFQHCVENGGYNGGHPVVYSEAIDFFDCLQGCELNKLPST